jgi:hypothetical protein
MKVTINDADKPKKQFTSLRKFKNTDQIKAYLAKMPIEKRFRYLRAECEDNFTGHELQTFHTLIKKTHSLRT